MDRRDFAERVTSRMLAGREEYGDESFLRPRSHLVGELAEEAMDLVGWGYVMWIQTHGLDMDDPLRQLPAFLEQVWAHAERGDCPRGELAMYAAVTGALTLLVLEGG